MGVRVEEDDKVVGLKELNDLDFSTHRVVPELDMKGNLTNNLHPIDGYTIANGEFLLGRGEMEVRKKLAYIVTNIAGHDGAVFRRRLQFVDRPWNIEEKTLPLYRTEIQNVTADTPLEDVQKWLKLIGGLPGMTKVSMVNDIQKWVKEETAELPLYRVLRYQGDSDKGPAFFTGSIVLVVELGWEKADKKPVRVFNFEAREGHVPCHHLERIPWPFGLVLRKADLSKFFADMIPPSGKRKRSANDIGHPGSKNGKTNAAG
jgi:hypothetical protein